MSVIDIEIDGLTQSVVHVRTQVSINTTIVWWSELKPSQRRLKKWNFDWQSEANMGRKVAALTLENDSAVQGLISFTADAGYLHVHLVESAPRNAGRRKKYRGVPGNLFAFASLQSIQLGFEGSLAFDAKSELIAHYSKTLGAIQVGSSPRMIIDSETGRRLVHQYFDEDDEWPS